MMIFNTVSHKWKLLPYPVKLLIHLSLIFAMYSSGSLLGSMSGYEFRVGGAIAVFLASPAFGACDGDFQPDGKVDETDLAVLAAEFGRTDCCGAEVEPCEADFDNDCAVDGGDLAVFIAEFGRTDCYDSLNFLQSAAVFNAGATFDITIQLESAGSAANAPPTGVAVGLSPQNPGCVTVTPGVTILSGQSAATATLSYGGSASLPCTTIVTAAADRLASDSLFARVDPVPGIQLDAPSKIGAGLQASGSLTLGTGNHGGVTVSIASADETGALIAPDESTPGSTSLDLAIADGQASASFYIQSMAGATGEVMITASAAGFTDGHDSVRIVQPGLRITNLAIVTETTAGEDPFQIQIGIPSAGNSSLSATQQVRAGGGDLTVTIKSSTSSVGQLLTHDFPAGAQNVTLAISEGQLQSAATVASGGIAFRPLAGGSTTVNAAISGFIATTAAARQVVVSTPAISLSAPAKVGSGLQAAGSLTLETGNHGGLTVSIASSNGLLALVSPDGSTAGGSSVDVAIADGQTTAGFYIQGLEGASGPVTVTASAAGFTAGSDTIRIVTPGLRIINLAAAPSTTADEDPFQVQVGIPDAGNNSLASTQPARAGGSGLTATIINSTATVGLLKTIGFPAGAQTVAVNIVPGQVQSAATVAAGGVAFDALAAGTTTVSAAIPGFTATATASRSLMVSAPGITLDAPAKVGSGLQAAGKLTLETGNHGGVTVSISSSNQSVALVSPASSAAGSASILVGVAGGQTVVDFFAQGVEGATGTVTITASAAGFTGGSDTTRIVAPGLRIVNLSAVTTTSAGEDPFQVQVGIPNTGNTSLSATQPARGGGGGLTVAVTNNNASVGRLVANSFPTGAQTITLTIAEGQMQTGATPAAQGVAFQPLTAGTTAVSAAIPGFISTTAASRDLVVSE